MVWVCRIRGSVSPDRCDETILGNTLGEFRQAVELVSHGIVTTVVDRTLRLEEFQKGIDALARSEPVGRVVLLP